MGWGLVLAEAATLHFYLERLTMNPTTQQVIEFLTHPELPFGAEEDVLLLSDPEALQIEVASLLEEHPAVLGADESTGLKERLSEADWLVIAQEFRTRLALASNFFEPDANNTGAKIV